MASEAGWGRLAEELKAAGFNVKVSTNPRGQVLSGGPDTYSIAYQVRDAAGEFLGCVDVRDKYGRMGKWYGWTVTTEGADSITIGRPTWAVTKRPEIVSHFAAAVATLTRKGA
jgi:hypothetical protein